MDRQARVFERAVGSVVKIATGDGGGGTGFFAREDGLILTAAHVVGGARVVEAEDPDGKKFRCRVVRSRRYEDVAALRVSRIEDEEREVVRVFGCPSCGRQEAAGQRYCEGCGTELRAGRKGWWR